MSNTYSNDDLWSSMINSVDGNFQAGFSPLRFDSCESRPIPVKLPNNYYNFYLEESQQVSIEETPQFQYVQQQTPEEPFAFEVIHTIPQNPTTFEEDVANEFFLLENRQIKSNCCFNQVQPALPMIPEEDKSESFCLTNTSYIEQSVQQRKPDNFKSLANRNLKLNFGTGFIQFLEFKRDLADFKNNKKEAQIYKKILDLLFSKSGSFVSFAGWRDILKNKQYGKEIRRMARQFFGKSFARTYVQFAKITDEYKPTYFQKIKCFFQGSKNPESLTPDNYNKY